MPSLAALKELYAKATSGKWRAYVGDGQVVQLDFGEHHGGRPCVIGWSGFDGNDLSGRKNIANASLIAALHNSFPGIAADYKAMQQLILAIARDNGNSGWQARAKTTLANLRCKE